MTDPNAILQSKEFKNLANELASVGRFLAQKGWSPATSSNYSAQFLDQNSTQLLVMSRTEVDKYQMVGEDFILADREGVVLAPFGQRSSAETLIHTVIYRSRPKAKAVLHTHSSYGTRLSLKYLKESALKIQGYELQKGLPGVKTHEQILSIPILKNSQNMTEFSKEAEKLLNTMSEIHGFLIAGHGLYTWGESISEAKRQVETFEFLFECVALELMGV